MAKGAVQALLDRLARDVVRRECWRCECLQGFIAQMEADATPRARPLLAEHKVPSAQIHASAGCEPCPAARIFAEYLLPKHGR